MALNPVAIKNASSAASAGCIMRAPPLFSTVRVNRLRMSVQEARDKLADIIAKTVSVKMADDPDMAADTSCPPRFPVTIHPVIPDLLVIQGQGPNLGGNLRGVLHSQHVSEEAKEGLHFLEPKSLEIYIDPACGESVTRGAPVYVPGVIGSSRHFEDGDSCSVWLDARKRILKGHVSGPLLGSPKVFLGNGVCRRGRSEIFKPVTHLSEVSQMGVGVEMTQPIWTHPPGLAACLDDWGFAQNLPSALVSHMLDPQPGERILDMCASPGGKATHIASLMQDLGHLVCMDRNPRRTIHIQRNAAELGLTCLDIQTIYDSTRALDPNLPEFRQADPTNDTSGDGPRISGPPYPPNTFDRVLVDAPCSSMGQRPILRPMGSAKSVRAAETTQYALLQTAVGLVKPGGTIVYSTCTIREEENERQIGRLLREFGGQVSLSPTKFGLGNDKVVIEGADRSLDGSCQKFSPQKLCAKHATTQDGRRSPCFEAMRSSEHELTREGPCSEVFHPNYAREPLNCDNDTIGFFMAKLTKNF